MKTNPSEMLLLLLWLTITWSPAAFATADGPDYFRISSQQPVNLHQDHDSKSGIILSIPAETRHLKNLGCHGLVPFSQWQKMTEQEKSQAKARAWCQVSYSGIMGWIQNTYLREDHAPSAPTFNCNKATHDIEKLICKDLDLINLDIAMDTVYKHALQQATQSKPASDKTVKHLKATQRGWIKGRNDCWKSPTMKACSEQSYLQRLAYLQNKWQLIPPSRIEHFQCDHSLDSIEVAFYTATRFSSAAVTIKHNRQIYIATESGQDTKNYFGEFGKSFNIKENKISLKWDQFQPAATCHLKAKDQPHRAKKY